MNAGVPDAAAMLRQIEAIDVHAEGKDGWYTRQGWESLWGVGTNKAHALIHKAVIAGMMQHKRLPIRISNGDTKRVEHYKWVGKKTS